jgi:hypothetical protein
MGVRGKMVREAMEGIEWTKGIKGTHSRDTLRNLWKIDVSINIERQDCKIDTVCVEVLVGGEAE